MSFKKQYPVPAGVEVERFFDVKTIDNGDSETSFFTPNPTNVDTDNNYSQNPFPENYFHVILGISLDLTLSLIRQDANVDPALVVNTLKDGSLVLSTNQGRTQDLIHPIKDYLNFNGITLANGITVADDDILTTVALGSTGLRQPDNLFYLKPNESFTLKTKYNASVWPTTANWTTLGIGRFGIKAEMYVAKMTQEQLTEYAQTIGASVR